MSVTRATRRNAVEALTLNDKLDVVIRLLQDLFILLGVNAGIKTDDLRKLLAIDKRRIGRISKHIRKKLT